MTDTPNPKAVTAGKRRKHHVRVSSQPLKDFMDKQQRTVNDMVPVLGLSYSAILGYLQENVMPKSVALAVEGLARRLGPTARNALFICNVPPDKVELFNQMIKIIPGATIKSLDV